MTYGYALLLSSCNHVPDHLEPFPCSFHRLISEGARIPLELPTATKEARGLFGEICKGIIANRWVFGSCIIRIKIIMGNL